MVCGCRSGKEGRHDADGILMAKGPYWQALRQAWQTMFYPDRCATWHAHYQQVLFPVCSIGYRCRPCSIPADLPHGMPIIRRFSLLTVRSVTDGSRVIAARIPGGAGPHLIWDPLHVHFVFMAQSQTLMRPNLVMQSERLHRLHQQFG